MGMNRFALFALLAALVAAPVERAAAQSPFDALLPFQRVEADPNREYSLAETHGPWMILAASFVGDTAESEARGLVLELRRDFKLEAFVHRRVVDLDAPVETLGVSKHSTLDNVRPVMGHHLRGGKFTEVAVLVGNYSSIDDPTLQGNLETLRYAQPKCLDPRKTKALQYAGLRALVSHVQKFARGESKKKGPLRSCFATRNPLLPADYFHADVEPLVRQMNAHVEHSLLRCPGNFSIQVATFRGNFEIDQRKVAQIERTGQMQSQLVEAAVKAHKLTTLLRNAGHEAYEFHDRHESIVTVGSFDQIAQQLPGGKLAPLPEVQAVLDTFGASAQKKDPRPGEALSVTQAMRPKQIGGISFDLQPLPIPVPGKRLAAVARTSPASPPSSPLPPRRVPTAGPTSPAQQPQAPRTATPLPPRKSAWWR